MSTSYRPPTPKTDTAANTINDSQRTLAEARVAQAEWEAKFPDFCHIHRITPGILAHLPTHIALMIVNMHVFETLTMKLRQIDDRLTALERINMKEDA